MRTTVLKEVQNPTLHSTDREGKLPTALGQAEHHVGGDEKEERKEKLLAEAWGCTCLES